MSLPKIEGAAKSPAEFFSLSRGGGDLRCQLPTFCTAIKIEEGSGGFDVGEWLFAGPSILDQIRTVYSSIFVAIHAYAQSRS